MSDSSPPQEEKNCMTTETSETQEEKHDEEKIDEPVSSNETEHTNEQKTSTESESEVDDSIKEFEENARELSDRKNQIGGSKVGAIAISISVILAVLGIILYFVFRSKPKATWKPIPYIWDRHFQSYLTTYLNQETHSECLLVYGAQGVGKSRGLSTLAASLAAEGRLPLVFDFLQIPQKASHSETVFLLQNSVRLALLSFDGSKTNQFRQIIDRLLPLATLDGSQLKEPYPVIQNPILRQIESSISTILAQQGPTAIPAFFEALSALQPLRPVILLLSPERAPNLFEIFGEIPIKCPTIPVIAEVSDQVLLLSQKLDKKDYIPKAFRSIQVEEFSASDAKDMMKDLLSSKDVSTLFEKLGGHGASFAKAYDLMGEGFNVKSAINEIVKNYKAQIYRAIYGEGVGTPIDRVKYLKNLLTKNAIIQKEKMPENLIKSGVLTLYGNNEVTFSCKAMKEAASQIVKEIR